MNDKSGKTESSPLQFSDLLKKIRSERGFGTQAELARAAGLSNQLISALESGKKEPGWKTVVALARALGVSVAVFEVEPPAGSAELSISDGQSEPSAGQKITIPMGKRK